MIPVDYLASLWPRVDTMDYEDLYEPMHEPTDPEEFDDGVEM